jgi:hypothetical protein
LKWPSADTSAASLNQLPETQQRRISERTAVGGYISIAEHSGLRLAVPVDRLRWLNNIRNDAVHRGAAPGQEEAGAAVQLMIDFLGAHGRARRTGEREPDGGEWVAVDTDRTHDNVDKRSTMGLDCGAGRLGGTRLAGRATRSH